jgi:hypothetical protein
MHLPRQFRTIIVPSSSFQLVVDQNMAIQAIKNLYTHLLPGGILVMPFMKLWKEEYDISWRQTGEKIREDDGATIKRWSRNWYDPQNQLEHNEDRYEVIKNGVVIATEHHLRSPATREYTQKQAVDLFVETGFVDLRIYKGFSREQASAQDELYTICGMRP